MGRAKQCHARGSDPAASQKRAHGVQKGHETQADSRIGNDSAVRVGSSDRLDPKQTLDS